MVSSIEAVISIIALHQLIEKVEYIGRPTEISRSLLCLRFFSTSKCFLRSLAWY